MRLPNSSNFAEIKDFLAQIEGCRSIESAATLLNVTIDELQSALDIPVSDVVELSGCLISLIFQTEEDCIAYYESESCVSTKNNPAGTS